MTNMHEGRTALVTGAARGIGAAIAAKLAAGGAQLVLVDLDTPGDAIAGTEDALWLAADVTKAEEWERMRERATERFGVVDIVVNNAGIYPFVPIEDLTFETWRRTFSVNIDAHFHSAKTFAPAMRAQRWGRFVNIGSNAIGVNTAGLSHYIASKMAVLGFVRGLANDLAEDGITVNAILPSPTETPGTKDVPSELKQFYAQLQAIKRTGVPDDMAGPVSFLASDDAAFVTGQSIAVDGGFYKIS